MDIDLKVHGLLTAESGQWSIILWGGERKAWMVEASNVVFRKVKCEMCRLQGLIKVTESIKWQLLSKNWKQKKTDHQGQN